MKPSPLLGVLIMAVGMMLLPVGDAMAKVLTEITLYSGAALAWSRFVVGAVLVTPFALAQGAFRGLGWGFVGRQALRGALISGAITSMTTAVGLAPLADVYGAFFIGPSLATILAVVLLNERARWPEWAAVALGLIGAMMVLRPTGQISVGLLFALLGGCFFGSFMVATRWATGTAPPMAQLSGQLIAGLIILVPLGLPGFLQYGLQGTGWILAMGVTSGLANLFQIMAFRHAGAVYLAPIVYTQIIAATVISWAVLGDRPEAWAMAGLVVIVSAAAFKVPWSGLRR